MLAILAAVAPVATMITGQQSADARRTEAERIIADAVDDGFAGQVLAVVDGEVVLDEGFGLADAEGGVPVDTATVFAIGSVTKAFTRAAVLQLADEGQLALSDPISKYLDGVPDDKRNITIDELLTMRAGLQEYHDDTGDHQAMTRHEALRRILAQRLRSEPGSEEAYSNSGYTLLAAIIENVSEQDWDDYIREHLLVPAGMERTGFHGDDLWPDGEVARGRGGRTYGDNAPHHWPSPTWALAGAGGMVSDADDLLRWIRAVRAGEVLGPQALARFYPADEPNRLYAGGDDFGFVTVVMEIDRADDVIIVNTNTGYPAFGLAGDVIEALRGEPLPFAVPGRGSGEVERDAGGGELRETIGEDVPDSPRGRAAMALVEALQDGSPAALETLVNEHFAAAFRDGFPMAQHLEILGELSREVRSASNINVQPVSEFAFEMRLVSGGDSNTYVVELQPTPPHGIIGIAPR